MTDNIFRKIPSVDQLLSSLKQEVRIAPVFVKKLVEQELQFLRKNPAKYNLDKSERPQLLQQLTNKIQNQIAVLVAPGFRKIVNGTGVILHTGLGRAPLGKELVSQLKTIDSFTNLEIKLSSGKRGERLDHVTDLLKILTSAEDGVVVNNNAAAVLLSLNSLANRKEVIVSRGELVEIGGSFRMPEVMKSSGAKMVEIGATNKTHLSDYQNAITEKTAAILLVHPSNFEIQGFTSKPEIKDIVSLAKENNIPVIFDVGSGALIDMRKFGFDYEPVISELIGMGVNLVTFSGDKLLGGPQSGIIVGELPLVKKIRKNHLMRALRCDKIILSLLRTTLIKFLSPDTIQANNHTYHLFSKNVEIMHIMANKILTELKAELKNHITIIQSSGKIGSGAYPTLPVKTVSLEFDNSVFNAEKIAKILRQAEIPVFGYITDNKYYLNMLALADTDISILAEQLNSLL